MPENDRGDQMRYSAASRETPTSCRNANEPQSRTCQIASGKNLASSTSLMLGDRLFDEFLKLACNVVSVACHRMISGNKGANEQFWVGQVAMGTWWMQIEGWLIWRRLKTLDFGGIG